MVVQARRAHVDAFGKLHDAQRRGVVRLQPLDGTGNEVALAPNRRKLTQTPRLVAHEQVHKRIKAVVASTMYDMTRVMSKGYNDRTTREERSKTLEQLGQQRWQDAENGKPELGPIYNELKGGEPQFMVEYADYYRTPRGFHPRPVLFIHGEKAHSRYFSETAYAAAAEPKELMIIEGANHVDLYDRMDKIPFDKLTDFFRTRLR